MPDRSSRGRLAYAPRLPALEHSALTPRAQPPFKPEASSRPEPSPFRTVLARRCTAKPLDFDRSPQRYSTDWIVILLIDELDAAIATLPDDQFFQNLRNLLMISRFHSHFRLVASGVTQMANLISSGSSPLNNLRSEYSTA